MKKPRKPKKKTIAIGIGVLVIVLGGIVVTGKTGRQEEMIPQVEVVEASRGDVRQTVDASGTVASGEEKTYFSPVNAQVEKFSIKQGDTVKAGTKLVEFNLEDLEKEEQKAALNLKSGKMDYKDAVNKSDKAVKKQEDVKDNVAVLEQKVEEQKNYVAALKSQLAAVNRQSQIDAQAAAQAQAAQAAAEAQRQAEAAQAAQEEKNREIQREYSAALSTYQNETLPNYQRELGILNSQAAQAQSAYNQAENAYQMAFASWEIDQSDENAAAVENAEQVRSQAQIAYQDAQNAYETLRVQPPEMPVMADFMNQISGSDFVSDGTDTDLTDTPSAAASSETSAGTGSYIGPDTSGIENALEQASSDLAELQSDLASEKAIAEAEAAELTKEEKEKMKITNNLSEIDAKTAEELVEDGKKGIKAEFNGIISNTAVVEGATVTRGMELFTLQNTDDVNVDINISKYDYDKVEENQKAEITLAGKTYEGTVTKVSHMAVPNEKGTPLISATVKIDDPDESVFLGVDAKVKIEAAEAKNVVILPVEVVNIGKTGSFCYVLEDGIITRKDITTGISSADYVEVTEGLEEGTQVLRDLGGMTEGMPAQAIAETGEDAK